MIVVDSIVALAVSVASGRKVLILCAIRLAQNGAPLIHGVIPAPNATVKHPVHAVIANASVALLWVRHSAKKFLLRDEEGTRGRPREYRDAQHGA